MHKCSLPASYAILPHRPTELAHCGSRDRMKEKHLYLTKHVHYFTKSLSTVSTLTMFHRVSRILETMYFTRQICADSFILTW
jgi:2-succinyl-5-enolpyruvyl-6-hydroxy-3-cyclohexene-1-carboxylate synthase